MAKLMPMLKFREVDSLGAALSGGKVYTYSAGSSTPKAAYTDSTGGVALANPVILDSNGEAQIWLGTGNYKIVVTDINDLQQYSIDNVTVDTTGIVAIANGGTGAATKAAGFDALSPMTTAGDLIYGGASGTGTRLGAGSAHQLLHGGTVPSWSAVDLASDVTGLLATYNGIATVGNGIASQIAAVDLGSQTADVGSTPLYAVPVSGAGLYRVTVYIVVNRAATTSSTMPAVSIAYTDKDSSGVVTQATATSGGNTTGTVAQATFITSCKASTSLVYSTAGYASVGATSMQYSVHIRVESL